MCLHLFEIIMKLSEENAKKKYDSPSFIRDHHP